MSGPAPARSDEDNTSIDIVELSIPVRADMVVLARLAASAMAARANFDLEEIEDLRLAVNELCVMTVGEQKDGRLALLFAWDGDVLEVSCRYVGVTEMVVEGQDAPAGDGLSEQILDALVDEHGGDRDGGQPRAWLRKRRIRQEV